MSIIRGPFGGGPRTGAGGNAGAASASAAGDPDIRNWAMRLSPQTKADAPSPSRRFNDNAYSSAFPTRDDPGSSIAAIYSVLRRALRSPVHVPSAGLPVTFPPGRHRYPRQALE